MYLLIFSVASVAYLCFCISIHLVSNVLAKPLVGLLGYEFPSHSSAQLNNQIVSSYHASIFSMLYIYVWLFSGLQDLEFKNEDPIHAFDHLLLEFMMGYMIYDTSFEVVQMFSEKGKKAWSMHLQFLLHHFMGIITHGMIFQFNSGIAARLMLVIYGAEVSTPFLNLSWILNHFNMSDGDLFKAVSSCLFCMFSYRLTIGPFVLYCLISRAPHWSSFPLLFNVLCVVASVFSLLNFFWYYKLYQRAMKHSRKLKKEQAVGKTGSDSSSDEDENKKEK